MGTATAMIRVSTAPMRILRSKGSDLRHLRLVEGVPGDNGAGIDDDRATLDLDREEVQGPGCGAAFDLTVAVEEGALTGAVEAAALAEAVLRGLAGLPRDDAAQALALPV